MKRLVVLAALALASCATPGKPTVVYQTVKVPVASSCVPPDAPKPPQVHTDAELKAVSGPERYLLGMADRAALMAYQIQASAVIEHCQ